MPITDQQVGELLANVKHIGAGVSNLDKKMEVVLSFQAATEERLKNGNKKFEEQGRSIKEIEGKCSDRCANQPSKGTTYGLVIGGFTVLGVLITIYKLLGQ